MSRYTAPPILIPKSSKIRLFFISENVTALSEEEKSSCEGLVTEEECTNALKDFDNNKTPGTDGLPAEFYRFFWPDICHDLLASYNFVLGIELLSRSLKNDPTIKGIQVNKQELKISQYADDTTVFVRDLDSVTSLLKVLNDFKEHSGLEINTTKTEAMWLGEWKDRTDEPFGFKWPKEPVSALGVFFSYDKKVLTD